ncbi:hypothetical protein [Cytobacillus firmus]|uniref:hypothetical protein n=1 Tax=Cytobacillus firmus TaxID=1399 RepID=UPI00222833AA|nr:hypothetical protein [Cytobacillus firmus]
MEWYKGVLGFLLEALGPRKIQIMYILRMKEEVIEVLFPTPYGSKTFAILDLDGNELGFVQDEDYKTSKEEEILGEIH